MCEFKKMAVNVCFILKHCFPAMIPPKGKGHAAVQNHHKHLKISMKDILFELATSYKIINPIRGIVPGCSPLLQKIDLSDDVDKIDKQLETLNSEWQKEAAKCAKEHITPDSHCKLKKFIDDNRLNMIWLDKTLFHVTKSQGS